MKDCDFILEAIEKARNSFLKGGFPAGAIVVKNNRIIGTGMSIGSILHDPTSHAEMEAIRDSCKNLRTSNLSDCSLYASMQPCLMCFSASMWSGITHIFYACKQSSVKPEYYGGINDIEIINQNLASPISFTHLEEFEKKSLEIVAEWERKP